MKHKFLIIVLFIATSIIGSFGASYVNHTTEHAQASSQNMKGYLWSRNIGWISLSCQNIGPCTSTNSYQVTVDSAKKLHGRAWSNNLGWLNFDAGCPPGTPPTPPPGTAGVCQAEIINGLTLQGWAQFDSANATWDGWVSFSSANDILPNTPGIQAGNVTYGPIVNNSLSPATLSGNAWGSTVVGWLNFIDVTIDSAIISNGYLHLKPSTSSTLTGADVVALSDTMTVPVGAGNINLYWYSTNPNNYSSCSATTSDNSGAVPVPSTWTGYIPLTPVNKIPTSLVANQTAPANFVTYPVSPSSVTYTLTCYPPIPNPNSLPVDIATATVVQERNLFLAPQAVGSSPLTVSSAPNAPTSITVPMGTSAVDLYWWKKPGSPNYTSCTMVSNGTNANGQLTMPTYAPPELPPNNPKTYQYSFSGPGTKAYDLSCTDGTVTDHSNTALVTASNVLSCNVLNFAWGNHLCPPGSPGYIPPNISWSTSSNALSCSGTASSSPTNWLTNPPAHTAGNKDVSSYSSGTVFDITCTGSSSTCTASNSLTLNYLSATDPQCINNPTTTTQCSDGIDNDGDGFIDFIGSSLAPVGSIPDPECSSLIDNTEFGKKIKIKEN